jgi:TMEM175 potassium channel family protein
MAPTRMETFSDAVIAIIMTIMVLELRVPHGEDFSTLIPLLPNFSTYVLSFVFLGTYWNNHHHMLQTTERVTGSILWANLHLLFWLSLVPFATGWMGQNHFAAAPVAVYGIILLLSGIAYYLLQRVIIATQGRDSVLKRAIRGNWKGKVTLILFAIAIPLAFLLTWASVVIFVFVEVVWLIPDRRIENALRDVTT